MAYVTTDDGVDIFYKDWGSGQPVVFSHGWPLSADDWDTQMLFFLNHGYRVIAPDRRGPRPSRPEERRSCRSFHRRRRSGALYRPPRREPGREGRDPLRGAATD